MTKRMLNLVDLCSETRLGVRGAWGRFDPLQLGVVGVDLELGGMGGMTFWLDGVSEPVTLVLSTAVGC